LSYQKNVVAGYVISSYKIALQFTRCGQDALIKAARHGQIEVVKLETFSAELKL